MVIVGRHSPISMDSLNKRIKKRKGDERRESEYSTQSKTYRQSTKSEHRTNYIKGRLSTTLPPGVVYGVTVKAFPNLRYARIDDSMSRTAYITIGQIQYGLGLRNFKESHAIIGRDEAAADAVDDFFTSVCGSGARARGPNSTRSYFHKQQCTSSRCRSTAVPETCFCACAS